MKFIIKTQKGYEAIAANYLKDEVEDIKVDITPHGYSGIILVESGDNIEEKALKIPEVERVLKVLFEVPADLEKIAGLAEKIAEYINEGESFAVETKRRGKHNFSSVDVNVVLGAKIKDLTNAEVNLDYPDKVVYVEIIKDNAYICIGERKEWRKYEGNKKNARELFKKVTIVQMPYWGDLRVCRKFGEQIGRAAQAFEVKELIIAPKGKIDAYELLEFLKGIQVGQKSRYLVQKEAYPWDVKKVPISVHELYQVVRDKRRNNRLLIITDPKGNTINQVKDKLKKDLKSAKEIVVFIGSREGIPRGIFRFADYVIDLAPYMTFATEHGIPGALIGLWTIYDEEYDENNDGKK
jgi:tRNA acetyltransferase TAN1